jgi:hypothetical protein
LVKTKIALFFLLLSLTVVFVSESRLIYGQLSPSNPTQNVSTENELPQSHKLDGFWNTDENYYFHYQISNLSCGPASIQMVFDYFRDYLYFPPQDQNAIAELLNTTINELAYTQYFNLPFEEVGIDIIFDGDMADNSEEAIVSLKENISLNRPAIVLMNYSLTSEIGHFRVVTGYNQTGFFVHDPWDNKFGENYPNYSGPNEYFNNKLFAKLWDAPKNVTNWAIILCSREEIPEFPSWIILPLFMIATLVVIIFRNGLRRKFAS